MMLMYFLLDYITFNNKINLIVWFGRNGRRWFELRTRFKITYYNYLQRRNKKL